MGEGLDLDHRDQSQETYQRHIEAFNTEQKPGEVEEVDKKEYPYDTSPFEWAQQVLNAEEESLNITCEIEEGTSIAIIEARGDLGLLSNGVYVFNPDRPRDGISIPWETYMERHNTNDESTEAIDKPFKGLEIDINRAAIDLGNKFIVIRTTFFERDSRSSDENTNNSDLSLSGIEAEGCIAVDKNIVFEAVPEHYIANISDIVYTQYLPDISVTRGEGDRSREYKRSK